MKILRLLIMIILGSIALSACGGGGSSDVVVVPTRSAKAVMKIETVATPDYSGTLISGITVTVDLPAGVSVNATPGDLITDSSVVLASGVTGTNAWAYFTYDAAARKVVIYVASLDQTGFGTGEFVTVNCVIDSGKPTAADFGVEGVEATDVNGAAIAGLTAGYTVAIH
jgi:hypothetical protein